jgi:hypothetical protein
MLAAIAGSHTLMNSFQSSSSLQLVTRWVGAVVCFFPSLLLAHPGHYHPDETDEFDFFKATFLHSHGAMDFVLIGLALASLAVVLFHDRPSLRISALAVGLVSLGLLPVL